MIVPPSAQLSRKRAVFTLIGNHMDAWQVAMIATALPLINHDAVSGKTAVLLLAIGIGYWLAFALNDYFDAPADAKNRAKARRNFFVQTAVNPWFAALIFVGMGSLLSLIFLQFGGRGMVIAALSAAVMWAYSAPPFRLKERPGFDLAVHALFVQTFPYFIGLLFIGAAWTWLDGVLLIIFFLASLAAQLEQQVRDYDSDMLTGDTFVTRLGLSRSLWLLQGITIAAILFALFNILNGVIPWYIVPLGAIGLPAYLHRFIRQGDENRSEKLVLLSTTAGFVYTAVLLLLTVSGYL